MALSRVKTWGQEELTYPDLNAEFNNILNNATTLISPMTANLAMGGFAITGAVSSATLTGVPVVGDLINNAFIGFVTAGTQPTYTMTPTPAMTAYAEYDEWVVKIHSTNTGAATLNISAVGAKNIYSFAGAALTGGELVAGNYYRMLYDGTQFRILTQVGATGTWERIGALTTAAAAADITFSSGITSAYSAIRLSFWNIVNSTNTQDLNFRISIAAAFITASYTGTRTVSSDAGTIATSAISGDSKVGLLGNADNTSPRSIRGDVIVYNPTQTTLNKQIEFDVKGRTAGNYIHQFGFHEHTSSQAAVDGVRIYFGSGNITGTAGLFGLRA